MRLLAISGSLRARSSNTILLRALMRLAPPDVTIVLEEGLGDLPHFNPDLDVERPHPAVAAFRARLREADAVVISSPEYAHGVPGVLKNALDWVVGSGEFMGKPLSLINASPASTHAFASLAETLGVMMAELVPAASIVAPMWRKPSDPAALLDDAELAAALRGALAALVDDVRARRDSAG